MPRLKLAALLAGEPGPLELWTLRAMAGVDADLLVVQAERAAPVARWRHALTLLAKHGPLRTLSRAAGTVIAARVAGEDRALLEELLDMEALAAWWSLSRPPVARVSALNAPDCERALEGADVLVRVSGGILKPPVLARARLAALNVHHGVAPLVRGMWSIPWGLVEGRADWIGATVHVMDAGIDTGPILWRGRPQLAPGDTAVHLQFRAHVQAVDALAAILREYAAGREPRPLPRAEGEPSAYRSAAGLSDWLRFLRAGRGRRARVLLERGFRC